MRDIYTEVSKLSKRLQEPDIYPWVVDRAVELFGENIHKSFIEGHQPGEMEKVNGDDKTLLSNASNALREIQVSRTFQGKPVLNSDRRNIRKTTRSSDVQEIPATTKGAINISQKALGKFAKDLQTCFERRYMYAKNSKIFSRMILNEYDAGIKII